MLTSAIDMVSTVIWSDSQQTKVYSSFVGGGLENIVIYEMGALLKKFVNHCTSLTCAAV